MTRLSLPYRTSVPVCHSPGGATQLRMRAPGTISCARIVGVTMRPRAVAHIAVAMMYSLTSITRLSLLSLVERGDEFFRRDGAIALVEPSFERLHWRVA